MSQWHRGHIDAELADRAGPDAVGELRQVRGDGVQGPAQTVIVEQLRLDPEDFLHRPLPGPVVHPPQGRGRGQPVGHQRLDDLAVRQMSDVATRAQPVDGPGHIQPAQKLGSDRQSAQTLLHHGAITTSMRGRWTRERRERDIGTRPPKRTTTPQAPLIPSIHPNVSCAEDRP